MGEGKKKKREKTCRKQSVTEGEKEKKRQGGRQEDKERGRQRWVVLRYIYYLNNIFEDNFLEYLYTTFYTLK